MSAEAVGDRAQTPESPTDVPAKGWLATLKRTGQEFMDDHLTDWAAALTYYAVLALFPAMLVLVALLGLVGQYPQTTDAMLGIVDKLGPRSAVDTFRAPIEGVVKAKGGAGALLGFGLLAALWSASAYMGAFFRASNIVWDIEEGRPVWKLVPLRVVVTLVTVLAVALVLVGLVVTGPLAKAVGDVIGLGSTAVTVWSIAKWPVLLVIVTTIISVLYYIAPNVKHPKFSWVTPGGIVAVLVWIVASAGFAFYVGHFGSYNKTYGSLGAMIVFLVWLWLTNLAILFGAELNSELERSPQMAKDPAAAEREPFMPAREEPKD